MRNFKDKPTLFKAVRYEIQVLGSLDDHQREWNHEVSMRRIDAEEGYSVTTLSCVVDQAGLLGIIRRLYTLGLPLISVSLLDT